MPSRIIEYRCILISPSDVALERDRLSQMIERWNAHIGKALDTRVSLVKWESNAVPDSERPPQASLNAQVVDDSDFGIAVFWSRIGTLTDAADSGSVEEVRRLSERGARVLVYFGTAAVPQSALVDDQFKRLQKFKEDFRKRAFVSTYEDPNDLIEQVQLHLTSLVAELLQKDRGQPIPASDVPGVLTAPRPDVRVRVYMSLVLPGNETKKMLHVAVQNHSPVVVFMSSVTLQRDDGSSLYAPRDAATGMPQYRRELQPGEGYAFFFSPDMITDKVEPSRIVCAVATDDIGRVYRTEEDETRKAIRQLLSLGAAG